jgi:hypothetical protein
LEISIPASVERIGPTCFAECKGLQRIQFEFGSVLRSIDPSAFFNCTGLKSISIPRAVQEIGAECFGYCESLESLEFECDSKLTCIHDYAFTFCTALTSLFFPKSLKVLCQYCFSFCEMIFQVGFEEDSELERIEESAFSRTALQFLEVPQRATVLCKLCLQVLQNDPGDDQFDGARSGFVEDGMVLSPAESTLKDDSIVPDSF